MDGEGLEVGCGQAKQCEQRNIIAKSKEPAPDEPSHPRPKFARFDSEQLKGSLWKKQVR